MIEEKSNMSTNNETSSISYHFYNEEIALDVLLSMCTSKQVAIKDIFISDITQQFIQYVNELENKNYDEISSFILLAATLLELKSSELLPKIEFDGLEDEVLSETDLFIIRTEEYAMYKKASEKLGEVEILNRFYAEPEYDERAYNIIIKNFDVEKMIGAFASLLEEAEFSEAPNVVKKIQAERFNISNRIKYIMEYIGAYKSARLIDFFDSDFSRVEIINTFLAILELAKEQYISITQKEEELGSIWLNYTKTGLEVSEEKLLKYVEDYN